MWLVLVSSRVVSPRMLLFLQCLGFEPKIFYGRKTLKKWKQKKCKWRHWGLNSWPFRYQTCMLPWLYQDYIKQTWWKTKTIFSANNKDSIIIRPMELAPLHVLGWVRVEYVKKSSYFITGSSDKTFCIQNCHSNINYVKKEFKMPT